MLQLFIREVIISSGYLTPQQHCFRPDRLTIDSIQEVVKVLRSAEVPSGLILVGV